MRKTTMSGRSKCWAAPVMMIVGLSIALGSLSGCVVPEGADEPSTSATAEASTASLVEETDRRAAKEAEVRDEELVYERRWVMSDSGVDEVEVRGELDAEVWNRVARPDRYLGPEEVYIYRSSSWARPLSIGRTEHGFRIVRAPNNSPVLRGSKSARELPVLSDRLVAYVGELSPEQLVKVSIRLRVPSDPAPVRPPLDWVGQQEYELVLAQREEHLRSRRQTREQLYREVVQEVVILGGRLTKGVLDSGWLGVEMPVGAIGELEQFEAVVRVDDDRFLGNGDGCDLTCSYNAGNFMLLGEMRQASRTNADAFLDHFPSYDGEKSNASRHGYHSLIAGIVESFEFEDEACMFANYSATSTSCTSFRRILGRYDCSGGAPCTSVTNFTGEDSGTVSAFHGTLVSSILLGDYTDGQGKHAPLNDTCWTSGNGVDHCPEWNNAASGMAREAQSFLFANNSQCPLCFQAAYEKATDKLVDVLNLSHDLTFEECDVQSAHSWEESLEDAFDDGVFVAAITGNYSGAFSPVCDLAAPADTPKVFAVNALNAFATACRNGYQSCRFEDTTTSGAMGGGDATYGSTTRVGVVTGVDLAAPQRFGFHTDATNSTAGDQSSVVSNSSASGTSSSTPVITGSALLVKDWLLSEGHTEVNNPGYIHTMMLAMGDRAGYDLSTTSPTCTSNANCPAGQACRGRRCYTTCAADANCPAGDICLGGACRTPIVRGSGGDQVMGFGRLKLRLLQDGQGIDPWHWGMESFTFTSSSSFTTDHKPFGDSPLPADTALLKCVLFEHQDTVLGFGTGYFLLRDLSDVYIKVEIYERIGSDCSTLGALRTSKWDASYDLKHLVAFEDDIENIEDSCVKARIYRPYVASHGITVDPFCYHAGIEDDE